MYRYLAAALMLALAIVPSATAAINVTASHPNRLMVDATRLAAVQAKIGTQEWTDFKAWVDANKGNTGSSWTDFLAQSALSAALVCRATGDTSYCTAALAQMNASEVQGAHAAWNTASFDTTNGWLIDPIGVYFTSTPSFAGIDFPIKFWSFYGTGALPTGLSFGTSYWIRWHHVDTAHSYWTISATKGGTPLSFSGTYSGQILIEAPWRSAGGDAGSNAPRTFLGWWATLYDWLYPYMTADQKTDWYNLLRAAGQFVSILDYNGGGKLLNNVWVGDHRGGILYLIAIIGDDSSDSANVQALLNTLESDFNTELAANGSLLTGGFIEGTEYTAEQSSCLWELWDAIYTSSGRTDNRFTTLRSYYTGMLDYYTHAFHTGGFLSGGNTYKDLLAHGEILQGGLWNSRVDGAKTLAPASTHRKALLYLQEAMKILGDSNRAGYAKQLVDNYAPINLLKDAQSSTLAIDYVFETVFKDASLTAAAWTSSPLVKWFQGTNDIFMKSGWDSSATNVNIFGALTKTVTSGIDHVRSESGEFSFYRKGTTLTGNWTAYPYDASNTLDYNLNRYPGSGVWPSSYSSVLPAAIPTWNNLITGDPAGQTSVARFETSTAYTYGRMDLTPTYQNWWGTVPPQIWGNSSYIVSNANREWLYLPPDILVIHDKIAKTQATPASQWNLQAQAHTVTTGSGYANIDTGTQSLRATVVYPVSSQLAVKRSDRAYVQWVSREAAPVLVFEANLNIAANAATTVTLSGATGAWAGLNGTWNVTAIDGRNLRINSGQVNTAAIATTFGGQAVVLEGHGSIAPYNALSAAYSGDPALVGGQYVEVGGVESTAENFLVVLEGVDDSILPQTVTRLASSNVNAAQIGNTRVVGFVPGNGPQLPIRYTHNANGEHLIAGLTPNTAYRVDVSTPGQVVIGAGGAGAGVDVASSDAGVLVFYPGQTSIVPPQLNVTPARLSFVCTNGRGNPDSQQVALAVVAGSISNWSAATAQAWLSVTPASATTAGVFAANVDCGGLAPGRYQDTIALLSTPPSATGSANEVTVDLRVIATPAAQGQVNQGGRTQLK